MNLNLVVIAGRLAVAPELMTPEENLCRLLVTVESSLPDHRVDLLPVLANAHEVPAGLESGSQVWVAGSLRRNFNSRTGRSRLEVVAGQIERRQH